MIKEYLEDRSVDRIEKERRLRDEHKGIPADNHANRRILKALKRRADKRKSRR